MEQIEETNFECKSHKKRGAFYVSLLKDEPDPFYCLTCVNRRNNKDTKLLEIDDILKSDLKQPIYNWPPGIEKEQTDFLTLKFTDLIEEKLREDIMTFYDSLQSELNAMIDKSRKKQLTKLNNIKFGSREIMTFYNQQFKRNELTQIFQNLNLQSQDTYKQFLGSMIQSLPKDLEQLEKMIQEKKFNEIKFRQFQGQSICELQSEIITIIDSLSVSLFNSNNSVDLLENYDFKNNNITLPLGYNKEQNLVSLENSNQGSMQLLYKSMCLDHTNFTVQYEKNCITIKNYAKTSASLRSIFPINLKKKQDFKLVFYNLQACKNFNFGLTLLLNGLIDGDILFNEFWQVIIKEVEDSQKDKESFKFNLSFDLIEWKLKITSDFFEGEKIRNLGDCDKSKYQFTFLFDLTQDVELFQIWDYEETD